MTIGKKIKTALEYNNMTQTELAELMNQPQSAISRWVNDKRIIQTNNLKQLCEILNISADWLLDLKGDKLDDTNFR